MQLWVDKPKPHTRHQPNIFSVGGDPLKQKALHEIKWSQLREFQPPQPQLVYKLYSKDKGTVSFLYLASRLSTLSF